MDIFVDHIDICVDHIDIYVEHINTRGGQKVRGKLLLYHIAFIDCHENLQIETTIHSKLTEI